MNPAEEFQRHEENRVALATVLKDPFLSKALNILMEELSPSTESAVQKDPTVAAARYHQFAGAAYILRGLERLTKQAPVKVVLRGKQLPEILPKTD